MYKLKLHPNLNKERWNTFGRDKHLLMIANEINRAKNWIQKGDTEEVINAYERAFELLDLTISITKNESRLKELLRFREMLGCQYISDKKDVKVNKKLLYVLLSMDGNSYNVVSQ